MQIELSFRDLKSHRYGQGFKDSLTRSGGRLQVLLLVGTLASFLDEVKNVQRAIAFKMASQ